ncbi:hypothetical protein AXG93_2528s2180 [Marchantia polymorpha subsp. ruderalis]|uniref:RRM domain-containing protein n=1 Tax=Marchantia polymorpha subsp. ruderalis TaxID=1480154 RepID=A0A176WP69_MARPO|nr:hypothetical protein AXG93_2528s2180 [Marchantia polymorpha subsp. ruderalis]
MAMAARDALQNLVFDSETNSVLRAEMAKKNLYVKRGDTGGSEPATYDPSKRMRTGGDYSAPQYAAPSAFVPPAAPTWGPQSYIPPSAPYDPYGGYSVAQVPPVAPAGYAPVQNTKDNPPCNTLFIGNLGEATSEAELRGLFSGQPGFRQMKVLRQGKSTVCFIEFGPSSVFVLDLFLLTYSKNPYGRKREGMGTGAQQSDGVVAPTQASQVKLETTPATAVPELNGGPEIALAPVLPPPSSVKSEQPQAV